MIRWRDLLTQLQVPWGHHHTGRDWISLRCPWCGDSDPSQNFGINERHGGYHCFRVAGHSGKSPYWLLKALGVPSDEMAALVTQFGGAPGPAPAEPSRPEPSKLALRWERFTPAASDPEALDYLERARGFENPVGVCDRYDLRVGSGRWAARLWFPLRGSEDQVVGFTGRAMRGQQPRYMTETGEIGLYAPRPVPDGATSGILVEGPLDALRVADALDTAPPDDPAPGYAPDRPYGGAVYVAALCGLTLPLDKVSDLFSRGGLRFYVVLDSTVRDRAANQLIRQIFPGQQKGRLRLPPGYDDPAEMRNGEVRRWLWEAWGND